MRKIIYPVVLIIIFLSGSLGCSNLKVLNGPGTAAVKILRNTALQNEWQIYQLEVTIPAAGKMPIVLDLDNGDEVDGYFYVTSGDTDINFRITADSEIYNSVLTNLHEDVPVSDRFSFTASAVQGRTYTLTLYNDADLEAKTKSVLYMELICPAESPIFTPLK